jgi:glutathione S-transferase
MSEFKLHYFPLHGKGEPIRMMLAHCNTKYDNVIVPLDMNWPKIKPNYPNGQVPMLEFNDGTKIGQSHAIMRYLSTLKGYYPQDPMLA